MTKSARKLRLLSVKGNRIQLARVRSSHSNAACAARFPNFQLLAMRDPVAARLHHDPTRLRNVIALGHPRLPLAQSRPCANIGQVRIGLEPLLSRRVTAERRMSQPSFNSGRSGKKSGVTDIYHPELPRYCGRLSIESNENNRQWIHLRHKLNLIRSEIGLPGFEALSRSLRSGWRRTKSLLALHSRLDY